MAQVTMIPLPTRLYVWIANLFMRKLILIFLFFTFLSPVLLAQEPEGDLGKVNQNIKQKETINYKCNVTETVQGNKNTSRLDNLWAYYHGKFMTLGEIENDFNKNKKDEFIYKCNVTETVYGKEIILKPNDLLIVQNGIDMPIGKIVLVKKEIKYRALNIFNLKITLSKQEVQYCVVKFITSWEDEKKYKYLTYESFYRSNNYGDFSEKYFKYYQGKVSDKRWGRFQLGHTDIRCGPIRLGSTSRGFVAFWGFQSQEQGDHGIYLAPTEWTDIKQVNFIDPRLKWYKYDEYRERICFPIDRLWEYNTTGKIAEILPGK